MTDNGKKKVGKSCVAMLLAGGQGSRLEVLTQKVAKPAVHFGGKYRIIDFTLSNCVNSGIDTVGVLTQYQPLELNDYIGNGRPWGLDRNYGGVHILPPYAKAKKAEWYKGTANAIYQNTRFIDSYQPEYALILSGDHIYKMDYSKMIEAHAEKEADCTIAVIDVPREEASRFGILNTGEDGRILDFEEKPRVPKSTSASMGVYVFTWSKLRKFLIEDEENPASNNDFGHNIIPAMLSSGEKLFAYQFSGYWKDVGTLDSLWEANMDLINPKVPMDLNDPHFRIYSRTTASPPQFLCDTASVTNSFVTEGCEVAGQVDFSVLSTGCTVMEGATVRDSVLMPDVTVRKGAVVQYAIVGPGVVIGENAVVGSRPEDTPDKDGWGLAVIGGELTVSSGAVVPCKRVLGENI